MQHDDPHQQCKDCHKDPSHPETAAATEWNMCESHLGGHVSRRGCITHRNQDAIGMALCLHVIARCTLAIILAMGIHCLHQVELIVV